MARRYNIPNNINNPLLQQDPVLASISDMLEFDNNGDNANQTNMVAMLGALLDRKLEPIMELARTNANKLAEIERSNTLFREQVQSFIDQQAYVTNELRSEVSTLKIRDNIVEQRDREPGQRIGNFHVPQNISPLELTNKLYNELYRPMFVQAAVDGYLPSRETVNVGERDVNGEPVITKSRVVDLPVPTEVIEYCHTLSGGRPHNLPVGAQPRRGARTPMLIVKLKGRNIKEIVNRYKKDSLAKYNRSKNLSDKESVFIVDDLTKTNLNCLNNLKVTDEVEEAFVLGGKIRFSLKTDPLKKHIVHNPFGRNLKELTQHYAN
jgi:hypothetical protein